MTDGFSSTMRAETAALLDRILDLPFNRELSLGTLDPAPFRHYVVQDAIYLAEYARVLAQLAVLAPDADTILRFAKHAHGAISVERSLHASYFRLFDIDPAVAEATEPSPACLAYTDFLHASVHKHGFAVGVAAVLPCFRIYWDVGVAIAAQPFADNPYQAWIATYSDPSFGESVEGVEAVADRVFLESGEPVRARMRKAYHRCAQYEWMFWESAYRQGAWPAGSAP